MRGGQPAYIKSLDFVPLGKMRKEQSGDTNETEKVAMISVLGALGYLTRESRPDLSGPVSILQSRSNRAQVSDIQETNRVVRLAKAHTNLALPVCRIPVDQICFVSYGDASGGGTRAEQAQNRVRDHVCGHVFPGRTGSSRDPGILEISPCQTSYRQCLCSGGHGFV